MGPDCDKCHPYPGCKHGTCRRPWECNCLPGWGGFLCDEPLDFCEKNPKTCENGGKCMSMLKEEGEFRCECPTGYRGKRCETAPQVAMKSSTTTTTTSASTTTESPTTVKASPEEPEAMDEDEEMAMQEPENAPALRGETILGENEEFEDIDNEAL